MCVREINKETFETEEVHISKIRWGDTIEMPDGKLQTVGEKDISRGFFCKYIVCGCTFQFGQLLVRRYKVNKNGCLIPIKK